MKAISSRVASVREPQIWLGYLVGACALLTGCAADAGDLAASGGTNAAVEVGVAKSAVIDGVIANDSDAVDRGQWVHDREQCDRYLQLYFLDDQ